MPVAAAGLACCAGYWAAPHAGRAALALKAGLFLLWSGWCWFGGVIGRYERRAAFEMARSARRSPAPD